MNKETLPKDFTVRDIANAEKVGFVHGLVDGLQRNVGNVLSGNMSIIRDEGSGRPEVEDLASDAAFEKYKEYSVKTNLRANERRMWAGLVDKVAGQIMFAAAMGIGVSALAGAGLIVNIPIFLTAVAVMAATFFIAHQSASREESGKSMDINDYTIKRQARILAKEIKQELQGDDREMATALLRKDGKNWQEFLDDQAAEQMLSEPHRLH